MLNITTVENLLFDNTIMLSVTVVCGMLMAVENFLIIVVIWTNPSLQTIASIFVTSMAMTDAMVCLDLLGSTLAFLFADDSCHGHIIFAYLLFVVPFNTSSIIHIALIAVERCVFITLPLVYRQRVTQTLVLGLITVVWVFTIVHFVIPTTLVFYFGIEDTKSTKVIDYLLIYVSMPLYMVAAVVAFFGYGRVSLIALKHKTRKCVAVAPTTSAISHGDLCSQMQQQEKRPPRLKRFLKSTKFFLIAFCSFLMLTFPGFVSCCLIKQHGRYTLLTVSLIRLIALNSGANFVILSIMNIRFRKALVSLLCGCRTE